MITREIPSDLLYTETHCWLARPTGTLTVTPGPHLERLLPDG